MFESVVLRIGSSTQKEERKKAINREKKEESGRMGTRILRKEKNDHVLCAGCYAMLFAHVNQADTKNLSSQ